MNYTKAQLEALPDLPSSTANSKLKVESESERVWLVRSVTPLVTKYEVIHEAKAPGGMLWRPVKRYPA